MWSGFADDYLHISILHCVQQVVQSGLLGLLGKQIKLIQDKDNHLVASAQLLKHFPEEGQVLGQRCCLAVLAVEYPATKADCSDWRIAAGLCNFAQLFVHGHAPSSLTVRMRHEACCITTATAEMASWCYTV